MTTHARDGRTTQPQMVAGLRQDGDESSLLSPGVGLVRGLPVAGALVTAGSIVGELWVLGVLHLLVAPPGTHGIVAPASARTGERAVGHGDALAQLLPAVVGDGASAGNAAVAAEHAGKLVFRSPLSGRFYARPSPDRPNFVRVGDEISVGQTIALLEVMKTFNRLSYGGPGLPERARVLAVLVADESDVDSGTPILELEAL